MSDKKKSKGNGRRKKDQPQPSDAKPTFSANSSPMDLGWLEQITRLMRENDLNTVELRDGDRRIKVTRGAEHVSIPTIAAPMSVAAPVSSAPPASAKAPASAGSAPAEDVDLVQIKSPMVGTFYASSSPDAKAFVSVGSTIDEDSDVCIIEAMKVFNNIKAECKGTIAKILVTNGQTVEFGQPLFLVKPN